MKEFIEKLIGRLEEISVENTCSDCPYKAKCDEVQEHINNEITDLCGATIKALSIEIVKKLAEEYKDDEEQGLLLRLPCKVGSTLYQPISNRINEYKVIGLCFDITRNEWMYECAYQIGLEWYKTTCDFDNINKTVFLTKEEAEQTLKQIGE